jgi:bifunctional DNA-binding transcriptional regulator/antitoxin component of YhaV-PrlF toxin-antitoxin module
MEITRVYQGGDLVIPREFLAQLGLKPGDPILVRPAQLPPADFSTKEQLRIRQVLDDLWGAWSEQDEVAFCSARQEMWNSWLPHN